MQKDTRQEESFSPQVQETLRSIVLAVRAVKLYPSNNPAYASAVKKSFVALNNFLQHNEEYRLEIHKNNFVYENIPFKKDNAINMPVVQDLFAKGVRELIFIAGLTEEELVDLYKALALTVEEQEMKSGITSILWEKNVSHIKVTETGLDEVITTQTTKRWESKTSYEKNKSESEDVLPEKKEAGFPHRTLVLFDLSDDPVRFGARMVELAKQTLTGGETLEDRLFALYKEAGQKIDKEQPSQRETLYESLAKSVLSLDPRYRNAFISDKLYGDLDADLIKEEGPITEQVFPSSLHEIQTGRFSDAWTVQQIATLLKKVASKPLEISELPSHLAYLEANSVDNDVLAIAKEIAQYSPEEMEELKAITETGTEWDIARAASRTLISLIPHTKNPWQTSSGEKSSTLFGGVITQLENMLDYLLKKKDYYYATLIVHAFHMPVEPEFRSKIIEALNRASSRPIIIGAIHETRMHLLDSPEYKAVFGYLSAFEKESTEILLKLLAEEKERKVRIFYLDLAKQLSKNQTALLGRYLSDTRWYFVRNIVNILGESKTDQAMSYFRKAADHKDIRIRKEIIQGLKTIGGKKALGFMASFLSDDNEEVQKMAIQTFANFPGISADDAAYLKNYLDKQPLKKKNQGLTLMAIGVLGNIGDRPTREYLKKYTSIRWWRSRKLQEERSTAAHKAIEEITWRIGDGQGTRR